jgi:hypothetical protein
MRVFTLPFGENDPAPDTVRFQPPFLLRRYEDEIMLDFLWHDSRKLMIVTDDIGSILFTMAPLPPGRSMDGARKAIENLRERYERAKCLRGVTLSIFAEGIGEDLMRAIVNAFGPDFPVFTIYPAPAVQTRFGEEFDDDAIVFDEPKRLADRGCDPAAAGFVVSQNQGVYRVAIYRGGGKAELVEYARRASALSWLTVRPGAEKRSVAFPPQLVAMIRQSRMPVFDVTQCEFLPSCDVIN